MIFYRTNLSGKPKAGHQIDFFTFDDGAYEQSVIISNHDIGVVNLRAFYNDRARIMHAAMKSKGDFGLYVIPCRDCLENGAHQSRAPRMIKCSNYPLSAQRLYPVAIQFSCGDGCF